MLFHSFELEKSGRGWKTVAYRSSLGIGCNHFGDEAEIINITHTTLSKIKKDFDGCPYLLKCVVEGHITAPTTIFQYIVECQSEEQLSRIKGDIRTETLEYDVHFEYEWVDQVPREVMEEWLAY